MFFYIGKNCHLLKQVSTNLFLDDGWQNINSVYYKGYSTQCNIAESIDDILNGYKPNGIWCVIYNHNIYHSELRGFPIYTNGVDTTNLPNMPEFYHVENKVLWNTDYTTWSLDEVVEKATNIFCDNITGFLKYNPNTKLTVLGTGGLDSALALAAIDSIAEYTLVRAGFKRKIREYSTPLTEYMDNSWSHWTSSIQKNPIYYLTGWAAESTMLRDPSVFGLLCRETNTSVYDFIKENDYMYHFLQREDVKNRVNQAIEGVTKTNDYKTSILSTVDNSFHHWHIDNNYHVSPFYDKRLPEICIHLSLEDMIKNCRTGLVQRLMIEKINPKFLSIVSDYKNHKPVFKNYDDNIDKILGSKI